MFSTFFAILTLKFYNTMQRIFLFLFIFGFLFSQPNNNGFVDDIQEMAWRKQYMFPMSDGIGLATDIYLPIFQENLIVFNISVDVFGTTLTAPALKLANAGTQYYIYEGEPDPNKLPVLLTRTPYNKGDSTALTEGYFYALLGYAGALQDMRGRYASEGTYLPMYSDSWAKEPYIAPRKHPLDITTGREANFHQDGYETLRYIADSLRFDTDGDNQITANDSLICNGKIGMFGASALGNSQFQAAAVKKVPEVKCLFPIVASGEFYNSAGHPNGAYREMLISGWLRGQVEYYSRWDTSSISDPKDAIHTIADYGPSVTTPREAAEKAIDFWTTLGQAHYPNSSFRSVMDISHAPLDNSGNPDPNGNVSRYTLLDFPIYNLTGWWDIFIDGQINTWQLTTQHITQAKKNQKLVIGPWAHQTIGQKTTGEVTYKDNVGKVLGTTIDLDVADASVIPKLADSELVKWFRQWLGTPTFILPPLQEWQYLGSILGDSIFIKIPSDTFKTTFDNFINFLNGTQSIDNIPFTLKGPLLDTNQVNYLSLPATGFSLFGDQSGTVINTSSMDFDTIPRVRFYVIGPIDDSLETQNASLGNYWFSADTFPIPNVQRQKVFLHANKTLDTLPPVNDEGVLHFIANPMNPVRTIGGHNMIVRTPDGSKASQGQFNLADPQYSAFTMNVPLQTIPGQQGAYPSVLQFTSGAIVDSFSIIGNTYITLFAKSKPVTGAPTDSTDCDFIVRFLDVYPDGREMYVYEGIVNARGREYAKSFVTNGIYDDNAPWSNIANDKIYEFTFPALPIAYTWGHNHKIKILISSSNYPKYQSNPNIPMMAGEFFRKYPLEPKSYTYNGIPMNPRIALQSVAFAPDYPTSVEFPVYGKKLETLPATNIVLQNPVIKVNVFPNPTSDKLFLYFADKSDRDMRLFTIAGKQVASYSLHRTSEFQLDLSSLPAGMYFLKITENGQQKTLKIIKQ